MGGTWVRGAMVAALALLSPVATHAAGVGGSGVPSAGGGFAGPADPGARGLFHNPAAALTGDSPELLVDVGFFAQDLDVTVLGIGVPQRTLDLIPHPSGSIAVPLGPVGLGVALHSPYSRGGDEDPNGPYRFYSIGSTLQLVETDVSAAVRVHDRLILGAGLRLGLFQFRSDSALDAGALLNDTLAPNPPLPVGDPLLEGQQRVGPMSGMSASWLVGAVVNLPADVKVSAAFRPKWVIPVTGPVELEPANDLNTFVAGEATVRMPFPASFMLAGSVPVGRVTLLPEVEYVGWSGASEIGLTISDLSLTSSDPLFDGVLQLSGLAEADFLASAEGDDPRLIGWHDILVPGMQVHWDTTELLDLRGGVWYGPTAVPDEVVNPGNVDFETITLRLAAAVQPHPVVRVAGVVESFISPERSVSGLPAPDVVLPSPDGTYDLDLWRFGATVQLFVPSKVNR
ncbi:MAG: outer membrane protein transport protein [Myxococcales bacterium]|nr:outer membrane protein transport protein [Myxococcales bacterium]